jgi:predicted glycoside hydrolase/deacetylase ChbG (UPF0249 family)
MKRIGELVRRGRFLITTADDFGIGKATSRGILELASAGIIKDSVLLVNSPYAEGSVDLWQRAGQPMELGWHPCLTLDRPVLGSGQVPSLVQADGTFWPLGKFLARLFLRLIRASEMEMELRAQYARFIDLVGHAPTTINSHHHVQVFEPVGSILREILSRQEPVPYLRRIREPWSTLWHVPGAKIKRSFLSACGSKGAKAQVRAGIPGNEYLIGITNPPLVANPRFLDQWLESCPGTIVELTCHPGHLDPGLVGRDCTPTDGQLQRRVHEFNLLRDPHFLESCQRLGLSLASTSQITTSVWTSLAYAA